MSNDHHQHTSVHWQCEQVQSLRKPDLSNEWRESEVDLENIKFVNSVGTPSTPRWWLDMEIFFIPIQEQKSFAFSTAQYLNVGRCRNISISTIHFCTGSALILAGAEGGPLTKILLMEKSYFMEKFPSSLPATAQNYSNNFLSFHRISLKSLSKAYYHAEL